jgi:hypothetical protein
VGLFCHLPSVSLTSWGSHDLSCTGVCVLGRGEAYDNMRRCTSLQLRNLQSDRRDRRAQERSGTSGKASKGPGAKLGLEQQNEWCLDLVT